MSIELIEIAMAVMFVAVWLLAADITFREKPQPDPTENAQANAPTSDLAGMHAREKLRAAHARRSQSAKRGTPS